MAPYQAQFKTAAVILDAVDSYARELGIRGRHPRPIGPIRYSIPGEIVAGVRRDFPEPMELVTVRNPSGYALFFDAVRLPDGSLRLFDLPPGTYLLRVESPATRFYQRMEFTNLVLPLARGVSFPVDLLPGYAYPYPVSGTFASGRGPALIQGTLFAAAGTGIPGVRVFVNPRPQIRVSTVPAVSRPWFFSEYLTDDSGQWSLVVPRASDYPSPQPNLPPGPAVTVRFAFPNGTNTDLAAVPFAHGQTTSLNQAALRGSVRRVAGGGIPGATVSVTGQAATTRTAADGSWAYYFGLTQGNALLNVTATLPDGSTQTQLNVSVQARQTVWVPAFQF